MLPTLLASRRKRLFDTMPRQRESPYVISISACFANGTVRKDVNDGGYFAKPSFPVIRRQ